MCCCCCKNESTFFMRHAIQTPLAPSGRVGYKAFDFRFPELFGVGWTLADAELSLDVQIFPAMRAEAV